MTRIKLGISACLLGENVRYDGGNKLDPFLTETLGRCVEYVPVCPEVECGLPVPREPMHLAGGPASPRLVTTLTGVDHTGRMLRWAGGKLKELEGDALCGFIFKSGSPSSGMEGVPVHGEDGVAGKTGSGIFARAFIERFPLLPVEDERRLGDPAIRENFIERVFAMNGWRELAAGRPEAGRLVRFHLSHKQQILSHSKGHCRELDRLVENAGETPVKELYSRYQALFMEALRLRAAY